MIEMVAIQMASMDKRREWSGIGPAMSAEIYRIERSPRQQASSASAWVSGRAPVARRVTEPARSIAMSAAKPFEYSAVVYAKLSVAASFVAVSLVLLIASLLIDGSSFAYASGAALIAGCLFAASGTEKARGERNN